MKLEVRQLRSVLGHVPELIAVLDRDGTVRALTGRVEPVLGADWKSAIGRPLRDLAHPDDADALATLLADVAACSPGEARRSEWRLTTADGAHTAVEAVATNCHDDPALDGVVVVVRDVRDRNAVEAGLRHRAQHDDLTELPTRALFYDRLEQALAASDADALAGLLFVDLDDFKALNDLYGHPAGDAVLVEVARRLRACLREGDTAARISGDEFAVLLEGVGGTDEPVAVAQRVLAAFAAPIIFGKASLKVRASIGVAVSEAGEVGPEGILQRADQAMYTAKRNGKRRWELYSATTASDAGATTHEAASWFAQSHEQRDQILSLLARPEILTPAFQPIIDLRTGLVAGYEALARFAPPFRRPPNAWFEQAHRCGLGGRLEAAALLAAVAAPGRSPDHWLSVNVSPSGLASPELQAALPERLDGIVIEITETEHIPDVGPISAAIDELRARGAKLALDDAGSGYAGLQHVIRLAPDMIKLDRSLVDGVHADPGRAALIEAFVRFARESNATVCAEGIENLADLERVADLDVTLGQGWAIGHPVAPWSGVDPAATATCRDAIAHSLCRPDAHAQSAADPSTPLAHDRRLEALVAQLAAATTYGDLTGALDALTREIHADHVLVSEIDGHELVEIGASGPMTFGERYRIAEFPATVRVLRTMDAVQIFDGDPDADPAELELLRQEGYRSLLMLPVICGADTIGLFEAFSVEQRPWSRFQLSRARILCLQLGAALERIQRNAPRSRGAKPRRLRLVPPAAG